ncbi:Uncharacterised protein [Moraxella catarrhalis]|nr:Uncharacterised protein [Moraxella catarrhalis]
MIEWLKLISPPRSKDDQMENCACLVKVFYQSY